MLKGNFGVRWLVAVVILAVAPALVSCGTGAPATGHVAGVTWMRGGVIAPTRVEANVTATRTDGGTGQTWSTDTTSDGSFSFDLPPGRYELTGILTKRNRGGLATPTQVRVEAGETTSVELWVYYP